MDKERHNKEKPKESEGSKRKEIAKTRRQRGPCFFFFAGDTPRGSLLIIGGYVVVYGI